MKARTQAAGQYVRSGHKAERFLAVSASSSGRLPAVCASLRLVTGLPFVARWCLEIAVTHAPEPHRGLQLGAVRSVGSAPIVPTCGSLGHRTKTQKKMRLERASSLCLHTCAHTAHRA